MDTNAYVAIVENVLMELIVDFEKSIENNVRHGENAKAQAALGGKDAIVRAKAEIERRRQDLEKEQERMEEFATRGRQNGYAFPDTTDFSR